VTPGADSRLRANDAPSAWPGQPEADVLHAKLVRADALEGCIENSPEGQELDAITAAIESYEAVRCRAGNRRREG